MIKKTSLALCIFLGITFTSCSDADLSSKVNNDNISNSEALIEDKDSSKAEEKNTNRYEVEPDVLTIYTADENTYKAKKLETLSVEGDLDIKTKLSLLAEKLSKDLFNSLPIEILKVETSKDSTTAYINLKELENSDFSWGRYYLQGSAGGAMTSNTLIETFKQPDRTDDWIDYIVFTYQGEPINFEHAPLLGEKIKV